MNGVGVQSLNKFNCLNDDHNEQIQQNFDNDEKVTKDNLTSKIDNKIGLKIRSRD